MRPRVLLSILSATLVTLASAAAPVRAHDRGGRSCSVRWGSLAKVGPGSILSPVVGARVGRHECFDRYVIDVGGSPGPGYDVRYTDRLRALGSGDELPVDGGAILTIIVMAPGRDAHFTPTVPWRTGTHVVSPKEFAVGNFRTFRDLVYGGSFEGRSVTGLGVRARLPFRVFPLDGPGDGSRLVVDVAHGW